MLDIYLPTTDGRRVVLTRHTNPETDMKVLPLLPTVRKSPLPVVCTSTRMG
ncbi:MAG: hypothetical protein JXQ71_01445 [Verrucomicrobia bacterium]|nr:hypothetical protein [Verrucomicrobiota bacterium]